MQLMGATLQLSTPYGLLTINTVDYIIIAHNSLTPFLCAFLRDAHRKQYTL